ncbi:hypothetical protein WJX74_010777 [Apatococcus lobatus]|uniref:AMP deaminase n=2 Tax=Apatococcus TaxID=904362 RepID=A0AAW1SMT3_9CHLO
MSSEQRGSFLLFIGGVSLGAAVVGAVCAYYWLPYDISVKTQPQSKQKRTPPRTRSSSPRKVSLPRNGDLDGHHTQYSAQNGSAEYTVGQQKGQRVARPALSDDEDSDEDAREAGRQRKAASSQGSDNGPNGSKRASKPVLNPADRSNAASLDIHGLAKRHSNLALAGLAGSRAHSGLQHGGEHLRGAASSERLSTAYSVARPDLVPPPPSLPAPHPPPEHTINTAGDMMREGAIIEEAALHEQYCRVITPEPHISEEMEEVCALLEECLRLRQKWLFKPRDSPEQLGSMPEVAAPSELHPEPFKWRSQQRLEGSFEMVDGVVKYYADEASTHEPYPVPGSSLEFFTDMHRVLKIVSMGPVKSFCHHRLQLLEQKFNLHMMLNADKEFLAQKSAPHRDFYNVRKVDTHVHHSACMHQKHLLRFIKSKLRKEPDEVVIFRDGKFLTLREVFESLSLTGYDLNVDTLDMHADKNIFHRFDKFNLKYNPFGQSRLREIFIKQDNLLHGRFLAELTREVVDDLEASKYQHAEYRISIYGRKRVEWDTLAAWICQHQLGSDNVLWLIQLPRLYDVYKASGIIDNFEQLLDNIFVPLFEVTLDPNSHPQLHLFLKQVVGFDMVDDESKPERRPTKHMMTARQWDLKFNPAYSYYAYYIYANLYTLNKLREQRGYTTFAFRPHSGEAGDVDHLVSTMLLCHNISHGINLRKSPPLQYLYYLAQIGLCMSPLSNNSLFLDYHRNPFPTFFARGLSISLSTDDPLQIHLTKEPLVEEYSVAAQVWKLSATDLSEIARNSVLHSGFPHQVKMHWVHSLYWRQGPEGNDIHKTNVPNLRMRFRFDTFSEEQHLVSSGAEDFRLRALRLSQREHHH